MHKQEIKHELKGMSKYTDRAGKLVKTLEEMNGQKVRLKTRNDEIKQVV